MADLRVVKPFSRVPNRIHDSFPDILPDPLVIIDDTELVNWLARHKRNLLLDAPLGPDHDYDLQKTRLFTFTLNGDFKLFML